MGTIIHHALNPLQIPFYGTSFDMCALFIIAELKDHKKWVNLIKFKAKY